MAYHMFLTIIGPQFTLSQFFLLLWDWRKIDKTPCKSAVTRERKKKPRELKAVPVAERMAFIRCPELAPSSRTAWKEAGCDWCHSPDWNGMLVVNGE